MKVAHPVVPFVILSDDPEQGEGEESKDLQLLF
jgi:hypothetical protein